MADEFESACCYTDLDSLFDTRIATIHQFGIEAVEKTFTGGYCDRVSDEFEGVDKETFDKAYQSRDASTLRQAMVTPVVEVIVQFAKQTLVALVSSPFRRQPKVVINVYPYKLPEEAINGIIIGMKAATENLLDIEIVDMPLEEVTPEFIKPKFVMMAMYDYVKWLDIHSANQNLIKTQCPQITLIGPELFKSKDALKLVKFDLAVSAMEKHASLFIKLILYPVRTFCVDMNRMKAMIQAMKKT